MAKKHLEEKEFKKFHECASKTTETATGGCLWGHKGGYSKSSCCYRWQAHEVAKTDPQMERFHSYKDVVIPHRSVEGHRVLVLNGPRGS